jgi:hypothetical protein
MGTLNRVARACHAIALVALGAVSVPAVAGNKEVARACASEASALRVISLEAHVKQKHGKFVLGKKSECLVTADGGNLAAVLVELPAFTEPYSISIRSLLGKSVLVPRADLLDATKVRRRSLGLQDVKRRGDSLSIEVFINNENADERFLVLYADPAALGQTETRSSMSIQSTYVVTGTWMSGNEAKQVVDYVSEGTLVVALNGAQWEKKK